MIDEFGLWIFPCCGFRFVVEVGDVWMLLLVRSTAIERCGRCWLGASASEVAAIFGVAADCYYWEHARGQVVAGCSRSARPIRS